MQKPKISIIMTTFERPVKLERAIRSVIKQTFEDWELIIIDDFSQDGKTQKIGEKYTKKDSRIRYVRRGSNFGSHTQPKNEGSALARADLIAYLDDDNTYRPDHLQVLWKYMEAWNVDVVYGERMLKDETGKGKDMKGISREFNLQLLSQKNYIDTSDILMKRSALEAIHGWDESLPKYADWNLWIRLGKAGYTFKLIPIIITDYYVHQGCNSFKHPQEINPVTGAEYPTFQPEACKIVTENETYEKRTPQKVAIFTLTMDRLNYTQKMHASMLKTAGYDFDWFVVDNGSTDKTKEWLAAVGSNSMFNPQNVGISEGSNQALDMIGNDYDLIMKVDNDALFTTNDWLKDLVEMYEAQTTFVLSPRVEGLRDSPGGVPRSKYIYIGDKLVGVAPHVGGISVICHAKLYKDFRWPTEDFLHGEQDYAFSQHALKSGYLLGYVEDHIVEHMYGTTGQEKRDPDYWKKRKLEKTTRYEKSI